MNGKTQRGQKYSLDEIRRHNTATDCWIVIDGKVYDVSKWIKHHPGGLLPLLYSAGQDCSAVFNAFHPVPSIRDKQLPIFYIGDVEEPEKYTIEESSISSELQRIHDEVVKEGGYETYRKFFFLLLQLTVATLVL